MSRQLYPIGLQSFSKIREGGYVYVDKTEYIHSLISTGQYIFLSRPRRFGKSLLISTIEAYFNGRKELFDGLAIADYTSDWEPHPIFHLDFSGNNFESPDSLKKHFNTILSGWEKKYNISIIEKDLYGLRFGQIIEEAHRQTGQPVVILIDEYDKPLLETVGNKSLQEEYRNDLRSIYSNLKKQDTHIRFAMLTGVTKFGHLSIFSDLNNLVDISMDEEYSGICGITEDELHKYFHEGVASLADKRSLTVDEAFAKLRENYDGYNFSPEDALDVYNPFSLLNALQKRKISDYWFQTGTPTFLVKMIKTHQISPQLLEDYSIFQSDVMNVSFDMKSSLLPVLYQAGYLTIKSSEPEIGLLQLGFPNKEVERGFLNQLWNVYIPDDGYDSEFSIQKFYNDVISGDAEGFMKRLQSLFADFNLDGFNMLRLEQHYQDITFTIMKLLGFMTQVEYKTSSGRIDMIVKTSKYIYIFEFKIDKSALEAIRQINSHDYMIPFQADDNRAIIKIGANFSSTIRSLDSWLIETDK